MQVNLERLQRDIEATGEFGAIETDEGRGRKVHTGTEPNRQARDYLVDRLRDADLSVRIDAVGNIVGRWNPATADPNAAPVVAGSHLDSVTEGGIFDGPLGVYAALESVRTMQEREIEPDRPVEVVSFTEEEGQRFTNLSGSSVASGHSDVEDTLAATDNEGTTLKQALEDIGYRGEGRIDASSWDAFLELHIEQGRRLEEAGIAAGTVTAITGIVQAEVTIVGEANHAGTTPMRHRSDALVAASELVVAMESIAKDVVESESESAVGTVGRQLVRPNATNVIPGSVTMGLDIRDVRRASIEYLISGLRTSLDRIEDERGVETEFETTLDIDPVPMSERCQRALTSSAEAANIGSMDLHSGAGHDAMRIAEATDTGMLFSPSRDGVSHSPLEWTDWDDCARATSVLAGAIEELALA